MMQKVLNNIIAFFSALGVRLFEGKKNPFLMLIHPVETMEDLKFKKNGSSIYATLILIAYSVSAIIKEVSTGFMYSTLRIKDFNVLIVLCTSGVLVLLFVVANWALCTLLDGEGRVIDIYISTCYCLIPLVIIRFIEVVCSNLLTADEYVFVGMIDICFTLWFLALIIFALKTIHNYTLTKTILNAIATVIGMAIIFFIGFLFIVLCQQLYIFFATIITELIMR